jgi:hypothetical protein
LLRHRIRTKPLARQQAVELIGRKKLPVRSRYRHRKTIHRVLAGQDHRNDRAVTEIHGAAVVFYSFDDKCHLAHDHRWHAPIARPAIQPRFGENDIADKPAIDPMKPRPYPYWGKQQTGRALVMVGTTEGEDIASDLIRTVSRHSLAYMLCAASEMFRHYDFDPLDLMIIHAVLNANVLKIMKNPELDRQFGSIQAVEPDKIKQGVSRAALSRFFGLPIETVRRRADRLKKQGIFRETDQGLIVTEANQFKFGNNHELQRTNMLLVRKFLRDLTEAGVVLPGGI